MTMYAAYVYEELVSLTRAAQDLVREQHTANLIALYSIEGPDNAALLSNIRYRLVGLDS